MHLGDAGILSLENVTKNEVGAYADTFTWMIQRIESFLVAYTPTSESEYLNSIDIFNIALRIFGIVDETDRFMDLHVRNHYDLHEDEINNKFMFDIRYGHLSKPPIVIIKYYKQNLNGYTLITTNKMINLYQNYLKKAGLIRFIPPYDPENTY